MAKSRYSTQDNSPARSSICGMTYGIRIDSTSPTYQIPSPLIFQLRRSTSIMTSSISDAAATFATREYS